MKIIQVMPEFNFGGAEIMCENLSYELVKLGHEVVLISLYDVNSPITMRLELAGLKIYYLGKHTGFDLSMFYKLRNIFIDEKPDIIHSHRYVMEYTTPASMSLRICRVHTSHTVARMENDRLGRFLNYFFYHMNIITPVALSENMRETIIKEYRLKKSKIAVINNGIPLLKKQPKQDYSIRNEIKLLHVGRYTKAKNHNEMLKAVKMLHDKGYNVVLTLVGEGELEIEILDIIQNLQMDEYVSCSGTTDDVYKYLNTTDIFILPSIFEGMPMTIIEAMSCSLPIVASNVGGIPEMIENFHSGILCFPTAKLISEAIENFITNEELRKRCGESAYNKVEAFSAKNMAHQYNDLYKFLIIRSENK